MIMFKQLTKSKENDFHHVRAKESDLIRVTVKREGDVLWSKYCPHSRKLVPIDGTNFDGAFVGAYYVKKLNSTTEIWNLTLKCCERVYAFGYYVATKKGAKQSRLGLFHESFKKMSENDIVQVWVSPLGATSLKTGVTVNGLKLPFDEVKTNVKTRELKA